MRNKENKMLGKTPFQEAADIVKFYAKNEDAGAKAKEFLKKYDYVLNGIKNTSAKPIDFKELDKEDVAKNK